MSKLHVCDVVCQVHRHRRNHRSLQFRHHKLDNQLSHEQVRYSLTLPQTVPEAICSLKTEDIIRYICSLKTEAMCSLKTCALVDQFICSKSFLTPLQDKNIKTLTCCHPILGEKEQFSSVCRNNLYKICLYNENICDIPTGVIIPLLHNLL